MSLEVLVELGVLVELAELGVLVELAELASIPANSCNKTEGVVLAALEISVEEEADDTLEVEAVFEISVPNSNERNKSIKVASSANAVPDPDAESPAVADVVGTALAELRTVTEVGSTVLKLKVDPSASVTYVFVTQVVTGAA